MTTSDIERRTCPWAAAAVAVAALAAAACSSTTSSSSTSTNTSTSTSGSSAVGSAGNCHVQEQTWAHQGGGLARLTALSADSAKITQAYNAEAAAVATGATSGPTLDALTTVAAALGTDAKTALAAPPPGCIPGESAPYIRAMADWSTVSEATLTSTSEIAAGNDSAADASVSAAGSAMADGNASLRQATAAINAFNQSGN